MAFDVEGTGVFLTLLFEVCEPVAGRNTRRREYRVSCSGNLSKFSGPVYCDKLRGRDVELRMSNFWLGWQGIVLEWSQAAVEVRFGFGWVVSFEAICWSFTTLARPLRRPTTSSKVTMD